ncbi:MAG: hypothetical protein P8Y23_08835 [Candidatus Lokiarchaeota archaeon]
MSIHGNQYILPLFNTTQVIPPIEENDELALAFYLLTKDLDQSNKIISFSRLLWPFLCVQGVISTHIILDGLYVFSKKGKLSNPPRQPLIGHLLRNIENRGKVEQLEKIIEVLTYRDIGAEEIGEGEESEFQSVHIETLIPPDYLKALVTLIRLVEYKSISNSMPLDSGLSTEKALDIADKYRNTISYMKGNALRWKSQIDLIGKEIDKWLIDINVQLKDIETRYSSQINKTSQSIDAAQIENLKALEGDKVDQWKVNEKKNLIENISVLFKTAERQLEEIIKMLDEGQNFIATVENLTKNYMDFKERSNQIDLEAERKLTDLMNDLNIKLKDRDMHLSAYMQEKEEKVKEVEELKVKIEGLANQIKEIIENKQAKCLQEAKNLIKWSLEDNQAELFSRPVQWVYMPLYAMFIEEESTKKEDLKLLLPGIVKKKIPIYSHLSEAMTQIQRLLKEKIETDIALRSNFEFSCENKNIIHEKSFPKMIQTGISILRSKGVITPEIENKIRNNINLIA